MGTIEVVLRVGRPEDARAAAPLVLSSGPEAFEYVFGPRAIELVESCFEQDEGLFGCTNHEVAELDGAVVAVGAFYDVEKLRELNAPTVSAVTRMYGLGAPSVFMRGLLVESLMPPPEPGELYVAHLGVAPEQRRRGIMTRMLEERIARARGAGFDRVVLDVARTNPGAQRLYERLGFRVIELRHSAIGEGSSGVPDHYRMHLELR